MYYDRNCCYLQDVSTQLRKSILIQTPCNSSYQKLTCDLSFYVASTPLLTKSTKTFLKQLFLAQMKNSFLLNLDMSELVITYGYLELTSKMASESLVMVYTYLQRTKIKQCFGMSKSNVGFGVQTFQLT